ncbi:MAG: RluA family pseudouridine synthase [Planctomycetes bacterium]|nr:RluA family pseudouridine synthase [Planctomycetota bacterium]
MTDANRGFVYRAQVGPDGAGATVLGFHVARFRHSGEAEWRTAIELGRVRVNGRATTSDTRLCAGDELEFHRPPWDEPAAPTSFGVAFEDEHVLVVIKPAGLQVLPAGPFLARTLLELVRASSVERTDAAPAHRLGRGTSGLIAFGKNAAARAALARQFREFVPRKTYLAWVAGASLPQSLHVRTPIAKLAHGPLEIFAAASEGRPSFTRVRVLRRESDRTLVATQPITGRPDQLRIHLAAAGAPIVGDPLFGPGGRPKSDVPPGAGGYLLHAAALAFRHPTLDHWVKTRSLPDWVER